MAHISEPIMNLAREAKKASRTLSTLSSETKNRALLRMADRLEEEAATLISENKKDLNGAEKKGLSAAMTDRLQLTDSVVADMARGLREVAALPDPVGAVTGMWKRPNGLLVGRMRIPLGVIGIIYESRPNVTADAAALCLKSGNSVILRGGSEAIHSNLAITAVLREVLQAEGIPVGGTRDNKMKTTCDFQKVTNSRPGSNSHPGTCLFRFAATACTSEAVI